MTIPKTLSEQASCVGEDPELWYSEDPYGVSAARNVCFSCPIRPKCLADAMINEEGKPIQERHGIWGAHTATERAQYEADWKAIHGKNLILLRDIYKRHSMHKRYVPRLEKSMEARRKITPSLERYDDYREVLDMVIAFPEMTTPDIAVRISRSSSWVTQALAEAWKKVS